MEEHHWSKNKEQLKLCVSAQGQATLWLCILPVLASQWKQARWNQITGASTSGNTYPLLMLASSLLVLRNKSYACACVFSEKPFLTQNRVNSDAHGFFSSFFFFLFFSFIICTKLQVICYRLNLNGTKSGFTLSCFCEHFTFSVYVKLYYTVLRTTKEPPYRYCK
jgi:amino acid transporter